MLSCLFNICFNPSGRNWILSKTHKKPSFAGKCEKRLVKLVRPGRFERLTFGIGIRHSIQLSYGRMTEWIISDETIFFNHTWCRAYVRSADKNNTVPSCAPHRSSLTDRYSQGTEVQQPQRAKHPHAQPFTLLSKPRTGYQISMHRLPHTSACPATCADWNEYGKNI